MCRSIMHADGAAFNKVSKEVYMKIHRFAIVWATIFTAIITTLMQPGTIMAQSTKTYAGDFGTAFNNPERGYHNRYEIVNDANVNIYVTSASPAGGFSQDEVDRTFSRAIA